MAGFKRPLGPRPPHIAPIPWLYQVAKHETKLLGCNRSQPDDHQRWLRRVSVVFAAKLKAAGYTYEGES